MTSSVAKFDSPPNKRPRRVLHIVLLNVSPQIFGGNEASLNNEQVPKVDVNTAAAASEIGRRAVRQGCVQTKFGTQEKDR